MRHRLLPLLELSDFSVTFIVVVVPVVCDMRISMALDFLYFFSLPVVSTSSITGLGCYKCALCNWILRCRSWLGDKRSDMASCHLCGNSSLHSDHHDPRRLDTQ